MKFYAVICEVFAREVSRAVANSAHVVHPVFMPFGLHSTPDELRRALQGEIDKASGGKYDAILLSYGLCSRGTADLTARDTRVVVPRAHDCITLLMGSRERYAGEFEDHPGTYYYSSGWIERAEGDVRQDGIGFLKDLDTEKRYTEYVEKYGEDNAKFLIEQENQWFSNYNRAVLINTGLGDTESYRDFVSGIAKSKSWTYEELSGDSRLIDKLMNGDWDSKEFLVVQPGQRTVESVNAGIITVADA